MNKLETEIGTVYNDVAESSIASALSTLNTTDNTFAILEKDDGSIIQVANNGKKGFYVEIQDSSTKNRIQCDRNFTEIRDVINLFVEFERNKGVIVPPKWIKIKTPVIYRIKVLEKLSLIGLALMAVPLYFIFTKSFNDHPFAKYIALLGIWLMVPNALIDTLNFIKELRRKVFDSSAMRTLIIILAAVLLTWAIIFK